MSRDTPLGRLRPLASPLDLVGVPYVRGCATPERGFDCFTLTAYVRWHWFNRPTPIGEIPARKLPPAATCALVIRRVLGKPEALGNPWARCEPHDGCAVALGFSRYSRLHHCGVWINGGVLHALDSIGVAFTPAARLPELFGRVECYECRA